MNGDSGFSCDPDVLQNPVGRVVNVSSPALGSSVQVTPSRVNVTARPGEARRQAIGGLPAVYAHCLKLGCIPRVYFTRRHPT